MPRSPAPSPAHSVDRLLTIPEAAERLNVSIWRTYDLARQGVLPVVRLHRSLRVSQLALSEFIASGGRALPGGSRRAADDTNGR